MRSIAVLSFLMLIAVACNADDIDPNGVKVACVGDSITRGGGPADRSSYPAQLEEMLGDGFSTRNFGVGGSTLLAKGNHPYVETPQYRQALEFEPDIVVIKLGTNDSKPDNWHHKDEFVAQYVELVQTFRDLDSSPQIWICLPVPAFEVRWGINGQVIEDEVLPMVKAVAEQTGVQVIDLHTPFLEDRDMFPDMIHPGAQGRHKLARIVAEHLQGQSKD